ncbi:metallophosphoesterase [Bacteroides sp.]|uniref:metallophosphoesterase family protein n=1 Tax=Bacteroides sp. TaxID=29523 RepID=UPI002591161B|nr:metallophosphoesterase [Bacteroides sp.]
MKKLIFTAIFFSMSLVMAFGSNSWKFAVVGDTHVPNAYTIKKIVPKLLEDKVEVVLFVGDLVQGGKGQNAEGMIKELTEWKKLTKPLTDAGIKILAVRGNHEADVKGNNIVVWKKMISPELNVLYFYKNITFVGLDNYINGEQTVDVEWLSKAFDTINKKGSIIVPFGHEPAFSCNTFHPECLDANPENRNEFWSLIEKYGAKYYFCGHTHQYNLSQITHNGNTIQQIICGGGGGFLQPKKGGIKETQGYDVKSIEIKSETGYLLVDVNDDKLSPKWVHVYDKNVSTRPDNLRRKAKVRMQKHTF